MWPPRDLKGYGANPPNPQWPNNARIAISFCLNYEEGGEYSTTLGDEHSESYLGELAGRLPKAQRDPGIESEFDYGARAGIWRILRLFKEMKMVSTAWGVGKAFDHAGGIEVADAMISGGHEIAGHGHRWIDYSDMPLVDEISHMKEMISTIKKASGITPIGCYVGRHSNRTLQALILAHHELGSEPLYSSDSYADDLPYWVTVEQGCQEKSAESFGTNEKLFPRGLLIIPYSLDNNDFKFSTPNNFSSPDDFFTHLKNAFDYLYEEGLTAPKMMSVGLHARISGRPGRAYALKKFLQYIKEKENVWITTRKDIAEHWQCNFPYTGPTPTTGS